MAVTYGFFNSVNGDRKYNADQMSEYFRGIVNEGVFQHLDGGLAVTAGTGLAVSVAAGRAIIQNRWVQNSAALSLSIAEASETYGRKDAVVIRYNISARSVSITVKTGTPAASPSAPALTRNSTTYEMALAYVNVSAGASSVTVTDKRSDTTVCGWATVAQQTSGEVDAMLNAMKTGFDGVVYDSPAAMVQGCDEKLETSINAMSLLRDYPITLGTVSDMTSDSSRTINIATANNRAVIGKFELSSSVILSCDSHVKFRFASWSDTNTYVYWDNTWRTTAQFIGGCSFYNNYTSYYILAAYSDDRVITDVDDLKSHFRMVDVSGVNINGMIACRSITFDSDLSTYKPLTYRSTNDSKRGFVRCNVNRPVRYYANVSSIVYSNTQSEQTVAAGALSPVLNGEFFIMLNSVDIIGSSSAEDVISECGLSIIPYNINHNIISDSPRQLKNYSDLLYDEESFELKNLTDNNARLLIGPFKVNKNITIRPSGNVRFQLLQLFTTDLTNATTYRDVTNFSWQTEDVIIPVDPEYIDSVYYYIVASITNGRAFLSADEILGLIDIIDNPGENPFNIVFANGWTDDGVPVTFSSSQLVRAIFKKRLNDQCYVYCGSNEYSFVAKENGTNLNPSNNVVSVADADVSLMIRKDTPATSSLFKEVRNFKALYDAINIHIEPYDYKKVTGSYSFYDTLRYLPGAVNEGTTLDGKLSDPIVFEGTGIKFSHTPNLCVDENNDKAYVLFQASDVDTESDSSTSVYLAVVDLLSNQYTITKIAGIGTYGGLTFDGRCHNPRGKIDNGYLYILFNGGIGGNVTTLCCAKYDLSDGSFTSTVCQLTYGEDSDDFTQPNIDNIVGKTNGVKSFGYEIVPSVPQNYNGSDYYCGFASGNFGNGKAIIGHSSDFVNWTISNILPAKLGADCEVEFYFVSNNTIIGASRHLYSDATMSLWKYRLSDGKVLDFTQIPDGVMRPTFFQNDDQLYLIHAMNDRRNIQIVAVNNNILSNSYPYAQGLFWGGFGYNAFAKYGDKVCIARQCLIEGLSSPRIGLNVIDW